MICNLLSKLTHSISSPRLDSKLKLLIIMDFIIVLNTRKKILSDDPSPPLHL